MSSSSSPARQRFGRQWTTALQRRAQLRAMIDLDESFETELIGLFLIHQQPSGTITNRR